MRSGTIEKEEILRASRELIRREGAAAVNIRAVAAACGVSVGSIYNHFGSKAELVREAVESVWREILCWPQGEAAFCDTEACIVWLYRQLEDGARRYPGFFTLHALGFLDGERPDGRRQMQRAWERLQGALCAVLRRDPRVREEALSGGLTAEGFAGVLFSLLLSALLRQDYDPAPVLEVIRRTVYQVPR